MLKEARDEQMTILREAAAMREQIVKEAHEKAEDDTAKMLAEAKRAIEQEKEEALRDIRNEVASLSLSIAEKILRDKLSGDSAQQVYINKLVDEAIIEKDKK